MQLGTQTASVVNHLHARGVIGQPTPTVGMGATELMWTDRHALTIVEVVMKGDKVERIATTRDDAKVVRGSGHDGSAEYEYTSNVNGSKSWWRIGSKGLWEGIHQRDGRWRKTNTSGLRIGSREEYRDPSF